MSAGVGRPLRSASGRDFGPLHLLVDVALEVLVERVRRARREHAAEQASRRSATATASRAAASTIAGTVVMSSSVMMRGFVSVTYAITRSESPDARTASSSPRASALRDARRRQRDERRPRHERERRRVRRRPPAAGSVHTFAAPTSACAKKRSDAAERENAHGRPRIARAREARGRSGVPATSSARSRCAKCRPAPGASNDGSSFPSISGQSSNASPAPFSRTYAPTTNNGSSAPSAPYASRAIFACDPSARGRPIVYAETRRDRRRDRDERERGDEMRRHERGVQSGRHDLASEQRLRRRRRREPTTESVKNDRLVAHPSARRDDERDEQQDDDPGEAAVRVLDHRVYSSGAIQPPRHFGHSSRQPRPEPVARTSPPTPVSASVASAVTTASRRKRSVGAAWVIGGGQP